MKLTTLHDLYVTELHDIYSAEMQVIPFLTTLVKEAHSTLLRAAFRRQRGQAHDLITHIEQLLTTIDVQACHSPCIAMQGLIKEAEDTIRIEAEPEVRDAALVAIAQRIEHYRIAVYGCVKAFALELGDNRAATVLQNILYQAHQSNQLLTDLAEGGINQQACLYAHSILSWSRAGNSNSSSAA